MTYNSPSRSLTLGHRTGSSHASDDIEHNIYYNFSYIKLDRQPTNNEDFAPCEHPEHNERQCQLSRIPDLLHFRRHWSPTRHLRRSQPAHQWNRRISKSYLKSHLPYFKID
jgi:hypothetical protein